MIRRSEQYNSDYMSRAMDERLEQLEERLTALYANAALETQSDFYDFMEKYKKDYLAMLDKLDAEKITKAEFDLWCSKKILKTTQYKEMLATLTNILVNTDVAAMAIIRGKLPFVVAQSYNFAQSLGFAAADKAGLSIGTFQVYNAWSVQKIIKDNPRLLPKVDIPLDKQWNKDKINTAITHSIIHGDSIPKVAKRLREVTNMDKNSAIRNARTSMTGAENLGRNESIKFMKKNGVPVQLMWSATHDSRTRDTHLLLDRTFQNEKGYFGEGILSKLIKFPGDPEGLPQEIYNCRCRASIYLEGIDHSKDAELYDKFMTENYPDDYRQLKEWEEKTGRAEERRQTLEYQKVLKEIHKTGYYNPNSFAKNVEPKISWKTASNREEANELLHDIGFDEISKGLSKLDEQVVVDTANRLSELNSKFSAITPGMNLEVKSLKKGVLAEVNAERGKIGSTELCLSSTRYVDGYNLQKNSAEQWTNSPINGWQMPSDEEYWNVYVITHEYGHMLQNSITRTEDVISRYLAINPDSGDPNWFENKKQFWNENITKVRIGQMNEIIEIAQENNPDFKLMDNISRYGQTNEQEFFAECFANSQCGKPNELGVAMNEWLRRQGYAI